MKPGCNNRAVTLVELIMAILLVSVIILTGISMELGMRRIFSSTDTDSRLLSEALPILTLVTKDINRGIGTNFMPVYATTMGVDTVYKIRIDANQNGVADDVPPDIWVAYRLRTTGTENHQLWTYRNYTDNVPGPHEVLSNRIMSFFINAPVNGSSAVSIQIKNDPSQPYGMTNPNITVNTNAAYRLSSFN